MTCYLLRLDDAHPGQHRERWEAIEVLLDKHGVKPIVAVVPENRDTLIMHGSMAPTDFWRRVRAWQSKGWSIGVHGLHHSLHEVGRRSLLPISHLAEFTGVPEDAQLSMIERALAIFEAQGVSPSLFVAPAHGFDRGTLAALRRASRRLILSDGFGIRPLLRHDLRSLPQQLWRGRALPAGTWTICLHPSNMSQHDFSALDGFLAAHRDKCRDRPEELQFAHYGIVDFVVEHLMRLLFLGRRLARG